MSWLLGSTKTATLLRCEQFWHKWQLGWYKQRTRYAVGHLVFFWCSGKQHRHNTKIGHINANSIAGFKFYEIRSWLMSGRFDIIIIILLLTETKIDATFSNSQFNVEGLRMYRVDQKCSWWWADDLHKEWHLFSCRYTFQYRHVKFSHRSMLLKVKINKSLFAIVGIYRSPNIPKSQWKIELSAIFGAATTSSNDSISTVIWWIQTSLQWKDGIGVNYWTFIN